MALHLACDDRHRGLVKVKGVIGSSERLGDSVDRLGSRFPLKAPRGRAEAYLHGLPGSADPKSSWQLADTTGAATPHGFQCLLGQSRWDADAVRDDLVNYLAEHLGEDDGVLVFDETGFLKKGDKSVGVARQYSEIAGRIENRQIACSLLTARPRSSACCVIGLRRGRLVSASFVPR